MKTDNYIAIKDFESPEYGVIVKGQALPQVPRLSEATATLWIKCRMIEEVELVKVAPPIKKPKKEDK